MGASIWNPADPEFASYKDYLVVADIAARDALVTSGNVKSGMKVYVQNSGDGTAKAYVLSADLVTWVLSTEDTAALNVGYINSRTRAGFTHGGNATTGTAIAAGNLYTDPSNSRDYIAIVTGTATASPVVNAEQFIPMPSFAESAWTVNALLGSGGAGMIPSYSRTDVPSASVMTANTAAFRNMVKSVLSRGGGSIDIPAGYYHVNDLTEISQAVYPSNYPSDNYDAVQIRIQGVGGRAVLVGNHATAPILRLSDSNVQLFLSNLSFWGRGSTTKGPGLELYGGVNGYYENLTFNGFGGDACVLFGAERNLFINPKFFVCRRSFRMWGPCNENTVIDRRGIGLGYTKDPISGGNEKIYTSNTVNGTSVMTSGVYTQESRATEEYRGVQLCRVVGGSMKPTAAVAAIRVRAVENFTLASQYLEGFAGSGAQPGVIAFGAAENALLTSSITSGATTCAVDDASWFIENITDASHVTTTQAGLYALYTPGSPATYEAVKVGGVIGNTVYLTQRGVSGVGGVAAQSWPSGTKLIELFKQGNASNTSISLVDCHLESCQGLPGTCTGKWTDPNAATLGYTSGEVIAGVVYDELNAQGFVQGSTIVNVSTPIFRSFPVNNSGKIQAWHNASIRFNGSQVTRSQVVVGAQDNIANPGFCLWTYSSETEQYINNTTNNKPAGYSFDLAGAGKVFAAYGVTSGVTGNNGYYIASSDSTTYSVVFSMIGGYPNLSIFNGTSKTAEMFNGGFAINGSQVVGPRATGWTAGTGTPNKGAFAADTATATQAAQRVLALEQAMRTHGLIN